MYRATVTPTPQREVGAISDPSYLRDRASVADIQLGQQLTEANFRREVDDRDASRSPL
jgi:hypothetical protein